MKTGNKSGATVLIVDDEQPVRAVERRVLEAQGYKIVEAANGLEGLTAIERFPHFELVIADLDMPELRGDEMMARIRAARGDVKVLYVTGFIDLLMDARPLLKGEAFLEKPFTAVGLQEAVSLLLYGTISGGFAKR